MKTGFFTSLSGTLRNTDMNYTRYLLLLFGVMALASCRQEKLDVTFSSLLEEMVDYEEAAVFRLCRSLAVRKVVMTVGRFIPILPVGLPIMTVLESSVWIP